MASFRPFPPPPPPQSSFPPPPPSQAPAQNQNLLPPPVPMQPPIGHRQPYPRQRSFLPAATAGAAAPPPNYGRIPPNHSFSATFNPQRNQQQAPPPRQPYQPQQQQQQYPYGPPFPPAPPLPSSSYPPPPPPQPQPSMYYPSSQYTSQYNPPAQPPPLPPPPPSSPPPDPSPPPPPPPPVPPPSVPPPPPPPSSHSTQSMPAKEAPHPGRQPKPSIPLKQQKPPLGSSVAALPAGRDAAQPGAPNGSSGRVETEEERRERERKRKEYEKQKMDNKRQHMLKHSQATVLQKTQMLASGNARPHGSMAGSRIAERRTTLFLGGERIENRLKKPTTFLCKMKFRNELPDPTGQPKLLAVNTDKDRYTKYTITSLEKMHKPRLYVEQDLGIPLDLLDISVYNPPGVRPPLASEDQELLRDDGVATPIKQEGIKKKDRPTDKGVSWLVKTQYISPLSTDSTKLSLTEKQAKEMRENREGRNAFLENLNNREKQIQAIEESFKAAQLSPIHQTNPKLQAVEILPLLPDFDRYDDRFVMLTFDGDPTADAEQYNKLDRSICDEHESQAIVKSFVVNGSDPTRPEKFLAYMVPAPDELSKDMYDENEEISYSWVREYHWDVRGDDAHDPATYVVTFDNKTARYLPLPTRLVLQKKRAKEGRFGDEIEHFPVPSRVTVRRRSAVAIGELKESGEISVKKDQIDIMSSKRGRFSRDDDFERQHQLAQMDDVDQFSGEEDMSD
uniref:LOW QUALITY PROTEIN: protein PAF1 homolog n=1 Tax=Elaeis guineensis var. tenera TaxID=51953 RepID=A0A6I9SD81_ELAGV|nr:LOW QUALITY PROTEIN: protein PAF1 homolog [Elaeis guineensis]